MRYILLVYLDEQALSDSEREHCYVESAQLARDLSAKGTIFPPVRCTPSQPRRAFAFATANVW